MTGDEIREAFLAYFESKGHLRVAGSSLIPVGDPTLLLTTAGMVQFKPYFSGEATPPNRRLTTAQKSFRTVDIDEVGDSTHLTLFEMLGNFSIGDYFKEDAIAFGLEFVTEGLSLPQDRFYVSIYLDDDQSFDLWRAAGVPADRIYRFGDEDNWWGPAGLEGPCGPCSELHYDFGPERGCLRPDCGPNCANPMNEAGDVCNRFVELWNLVFMQFYHHLDGTRTPLPAPSVDTGLGLERAAMVLQDVPTFYETDLFTPLVRRVEELGGRSYGADAETGYAMRVVVEHGRSAAFLLADGVVPGNEGRGYVLRRIVRRAIRHGRRLGLEDPFLGEIARATADLMGGTYPELRSNLEFVLTSLRLEEEKFQQVFDNGNRTLSGMIEYREVHRGALPELAKFAQEQNPGSENAGAVLEQHEFIGYDPDAGEYERQGHEAAAMVASEVVHAALEAIEQQNAEDISLAIAQVAVWGNTLSGREAFFLHDTYGFPVEMTQEIAEEAGVAVDMDGFEREMTAQRERARSTARFGGDRAKIRVYESLGVGATRFLGYETVTARSVVVGLVSGGEAVGEVGGDAEAEVVLVETPFYAEGGGQVGDSGELIGPNGRIEVTDTQMVMPDVIAHSGRVVEGAVALGDTVDAFVDPVKREDAARSHTATHLLHAALRQVLGPHVRQAGSLVAPDRLRFDFSHVQAVTDEELWDVQYLVNEKIRQNASVLKDEDSYASAIQRGALAFFGDKYGDTVRLIEIANGATFSFEVCGGTHVGRTGEVGAVYILGESGIGAGMRRIEAISGRSAERMVWESMGRDARLIERLHTTVPELEERVEGLLGEIESLRRDREALERRMSLQAAEGLLDSREVVDGITVLAARTTASSAESLRETGDWLRDKLGTGVVVLGSVVGGRPLLVAMVTQDLVARGLDAATIARGAARAIQGGGGGRPDVAQAGGKLPEKLDDALGMVAGLVREKGAGP